MSITQVEKICSCRAIMELSLDDGEIGYVVKTHAQETTLEEVI